MFFLPSLSRHSALVFCSFITLRAALRSGRRTRRGHSSERGLVPFLSAGCAVSFSIPTEKDPVKARNQNQLQAWRLELLLAAAAARQRCKDKPGGAAIAGLVCLHVGVFFFVLFFEDAFYRVSG